ncbi:MAG TPA: hypothetical protein VK894_02785 [Jiangellales bacterium]|nr:hypothetical protein [Jiangellales bacterium]
MTTSTPDRWRALAVLALAVTQVLSAPLTPLLLGDDASPGAVSDENATVLTPAGYAFAIWGVIYLACLGLAVRQVLPAQRVREVHRRTGWWLALAFACSTAWVPLFGAGLLWVAQVVIVVLVVALAVALARLTGLAPLGGAGDRWLLAGPVSLYLGWASLASVAGAATTGVAYGAPAEGIAPALIAVAVLAVVTGLGVWVVSTVVAAGGFAVAAAWALVAVAVVTPETPVAVTAWVGAALLLGTLAVRVARSGHRVRVLLG